MKKLFVITLAALAASICAVQAQQTLVTYTPDGVTTYDTTEPSSEVLDTTRFVVSYRMLYERRPENEQPTSCCSRSGATSRNSTPTRRGRPTRSCASRRPSR